MRANTRRSLIRSALLLPVVFVLGACLGPARFTDPVPLALCGAIGALPSRTDCSPKDPAAPGPDPATLEGNARTLAKWISDGLVQAGAAAEPIGEVATRRVDLEFPSLIVAAKRAGPGGIRRAPAVAMTARPALDSSRRALFAQLSRLGLLPPLQALDRSRLLAPFSPSPVALGDHAERVPDARPLPDAAFAPLSREAVHAAVRHDLPRIDHCVDAALAGHSAANGVVTVQLVIAPSGTVSRAQTIGNTTGDAGLSACVSSVLRQVTFPKAGRFMSTTYEFFVHDMGTMGFVAGGR
jgi:hypothetical protein